MKKLFLIIFPGLISCQGGNFSASNFKNKPTPQHPEQKDIVSQSDLLVEGDVVSIDVAEAGPPPTTQEEKEVRPSESSVIIGQVQKVPQFALMASDFQCSSCHLDVKGSLVSDRAVGSWVGGGQQSAMKVTGDWFGAAEISLQSGEGIPSAVVEGTVFDHHHGAPLPADIDGDNKPDFPQFPAIPNNTGTLSATESLKGTPPQNNAYFGTFDNPIKIKGEVYFDGDLALAGVIEGIGTIYVSGDIYILNDITLKNSPFPFSEDPTVAEAEAEKFLRENSEQHAIALVAKGAIYIGEPDAALGMQNSDDQQYETPQSAIFDWFPGGQEAIEKRLTQSTCTMRNNKSQVELIESFLYAQDGIYGFVSSSYSISGGIMTNKFHLLGMDDNCLPNPKHGLPGDRNYIQYDYRLKQGLNIMQAFESYF